MEHTSAVSIDFFYCDWADVSACDRLQSATVPVLVKEQKLASSASTRDALS